MSETDRLNNLVQPLIPLVISGDKSALDQLVRACQQRVYRWALAKTADADDADEVAQSVLIGLEKKVGTFRGDASFTSWLYRLVNNAVIDLQRRGARRTKLSEREALRLSHEQADHADTEARRLEDIHAAQVAALARTFFEDLPLHQREIFDLVDLQGFTPAEVSKMNGMNGSTVRAHLFKARRTIRKRILVEIPALQEEVVE